MNQEDFQQTVSVLERVTLRSWREFLGSAEGGWIADRLRLAADIAARTGHSRSRSRKPARDIVGILGNRLLSDHRAGQAIRAVVLGSVSGTRWRRLRAAYLTHAPDGTALRSVKETPDGPGVRALASGWRQGSRWAHAFCEICGLPASLASNRRNALPDDETTEAHRPLPALHDFQLEIYEDTRKLLAGPTGQTAILSLPTGAGKTRVAIDALLDHLSLRTPGSKRNAILWIAQSDELLRQAWDCFRQGWQCPPIRQGQRDIPRSGLLTIRRAWGGGLDPYAMELGDEPTVLLAGVQQLGQWINHAGTLPPWPAHRFAAVVIDEAHRLITPRQRDVLVGLGLCKRYRWEPLQSSPPVIGLSATPWRSGPDATDEMLRYFQRQLLRADTLGKRPIATLQRRRFLSRIRPEPLVSRQSPAMTPAQAARYRTFRELPSDYLGALGRHPERNALILRRLLRLPRSSSVLVFACSVEHAEVLALALNAAGRMARCVSADTPRQERLAVLDAFRNRELGFVCNVGVLTTGFDAPKIDVVCITRPTTSAILYEQMVGRGLRGPRNGGTGTCTVLDVQDEGLPDEIMSYGRVLRIWES